MLTSEAVAANCSQVQSKTNATTASEIKFAYGVSTFTYDYLPNVDTVTEMVDMMGATRAYEANVAAVGAVKGMAMKAMEIGRA